MVIKFTKNDTLAYKLLPQEIQDKFSDKLHIWSETFDFIERGKEWRRDYMFLIEYTFKKCGIIKVKMDLSMTPWMCNPGETRYFQNNYMDIYDWDYSYEIDGMQRSLFEFEVS